LAVGRGEVVFQGIAAAAVRSGSEGEEPVGRALRVGRSRGAETVMGVRWYSGFDLIWGAHALQLCFVIDLLRAIEGPLRRRLPPGP
jgi:hypothetical protein